MENRALRAIVAGTKQKHLEKTYTFLPLQTNHWKLPPRQGSSWLLTSVAFVPSIEAREMDVPQSNMLKQFLWAPSPHRHQHMFLPLRINYTEGSMPGKSPLWIGNKFSIPKWCCMLCHRVALCICPQAVLRWRGGRLLHSCKDPAPLCLSTWQSLAQQQSRQGVFLPVLQRGWSEHRENEMTFPR